MSNDDDKWLWLKFQASWSLKHNFLKVKLDFVVLLKYDIAVQKLDKIWLNPGTQIQKVYDFIIQNLSQ